MWDEFKQELDISLEVELYLVVLQNHSASSYFAGTRFLNGCLHIVWINCMSDNWLFELLQIMFLN